MAGYETKYAETEALRMLMLGRSDKAEQILGDLTVGERNDLAAAARTLVDLAYVPSWGDLDDSDDEPNPAIAPDARERLARHLYITALHATLEAAGKAEWDTGRAEPRGVDDCYSRADEMLAVITGTKEN